MENPKSIFGIHSVTLYNRTTYVPICFLRVLGNCELSLSAEFEELRGGSNLYVWDSEITQITSEINLTAREYPIKGMQLLLGGELTEYESEENGEIVDDENINGTIISSTGIASIIVSDASELKEGEYIIYASDATKVDIYAMTDVNFGRGTKITLGDDNKIASDIVIAQSTPSIIPNLGVTLNGGGGTIALQAGDSARFSVRRPLVTGAKLVVGSSNSEFSEFGAYLQAQRKKDGSLTKIDAYRCVAAGMPINMAEKAYSEWSVTIKMLYDSDRGKVFDFVTQK